MIQVACEALGGIKPKKMVTVLGKLLQEKIIEELEAKVKCLLVETEELHDELKDKKEKAQLSMKKANELIAVIWNIQGYVRNLSNIVNKARLFGSNLVQINLVTGAKVVAIFVNLLLINGEPLRTYEEPLH